MILQGLQQSHKANGDLAASGIPLPTAFWMVNLRAMSLGPTYTNIYEGETKRKQKPWEFCSVLPHTLNCMCVSLFKFHICILEQFYCCPKWPALPRHIKVLFRVLGIYNFALHLKLRHYEKAKTFETIFHLFLQSSENKWKTLGKYLHIF